jgi:hypothetical protein
MPPPPKLAPFGMRGIRGIRIDGSFPEPEALDGGLGGSGGFDGALAGGGARSLSFSRSLCA